MALKKKKKGSSSGSKKVCPQEVAETTRAIVRERERSMCPRLGDAAVRSARAEAILFETVLFKIQRSMKEGKSDLDLSRAQLATVPPEVRETSNIVRLDLSRNRIFGGVFEAIGHLTSLETLNLAKNFLNGPLKVLPLPKLEVLLLDENNITELPEHFGTDFPAMKTFSVNRNALTTLPISLGHWKNLKFFAARHNRLESLGSLLKDWENLETIFLSKNRLLDLGLDTEDSVLKNLQELDVRSNLLVTVPLALKSCSNLKRLHLGDNKLTSFPPEIFESLVNLQELHLYKNKIDSLPDQVGCLQKCETMTLSSTGLQTLPETISQCTSLEELYLNNCPKLAAFPTSTRLRNLRELQAKKCPSLKALPAAAVDWTSLEELDLRAAKKQVCKVPQEVRAALGTRCHIRGGVR